MANEASTFYEQWAGRMQKAKAGAPDAVKGFNGLFAAVMKDGALSLRDKELIAVSLGMAMRCDPCVYLHVKKCLEAGATPEQIMEAAEVVVMMQGGPGYTYLPKIAEAIEAAGEGDQR